MLDQPKTFSLVFLALVCTIFLAPIGCGYHLVANSGAHGETTAAHAPLPVVAIPLFSNNSTEIGMESLFANTFIETFAHSQAMRVTPRPENADLVLEGKIASVALSSTAYFNINRSVVRRATIRVELQLRRRSTGKVIWKDHGIVQEDYVVDQTYQEGEALKDMGLRRGAASLAQRMLDKVLLVI